MKLNKWNWKKHEYEPLEVPDDWNCKTYSPDMNEIINCPHCGKEISFGDGYTSREIQTEYGFGYMVCADCYRKEWDRESEAKSND